MLVLNVWLEVSAEPIGHLLRGDDGELAFIYAAQWLADPQAHPLSVSMPLREQPYGDALVRAWFGNLLQENDQLDATMARHGIARNDVAGLLAHLGADCAGAVSVLAEGQPPVKRPGMLAGDYEPLDEASLDAIVDRLASGRQLPDAVIDPSPVAGVRRKIALAALPDGRFALPKPGSGVPTTHILKLPDRRHPGEARDEAFVTRLAARCGLPVGNCVADQIAGHDVLLIERFDRAVAEGMVYRGHVEDFAQACGLPAELKYQRRGSPERRFDAAAIGTILAATDQPALSRALFLKMTLFNLLIGNNDNHAKNNGLVLRAGGSVQLSPFYDLTPVLTVPGYIEELAFNIGAATRCEEIGLDDLVRFCRDIGIPARSAPALVRAATADLIDQIEHLSAEFPRPMAALDRLFGGTASHLNELLQLGRSLRERDAHVTRGGGWLLS